MRREGSLDLRLFHGFRRSVPLHCTEPPQLGEWDDGGGLPPQVDHLVRLSRFWAASRLSAHAVNGAGRISGRSASICGRAQPATPKAERAGKIDPGPGAAADGGCRPAGRSGPEATGRTGRCPAPPVWPAGHLASWHKTAPPGRPRRQGPGGVTSSVGRSAARWCTSQWSSRRLAAAISAGSPCRSRRGGGHRDAPRAALRLVRAGGDEPLADGAGPVLDRDGELARRPIAHRSGAAPAL